MTDPPGPNPPHPPSWLSAAAVCFALACIWFSHEPATLYSADAACYARIAQLLAARPFTQWADVTWRAGPFFEHPPLALWLLAVAFRIGGTTVLTAWVWARVLSTVLLFQ